MNKVIGSRVDLNDDNNKYAVEFRTYIEDLFDNDTVQKLDRFTQHFHTSRLQHSLNVSYYSYRIAKVIGCDCRAAARAGSFTRPFSGMIGGIKKTPQDARISPSKTGS